MKLSSAIISLLLLALPQTMSAQSVDEGPVRCEILDPVTKKKFGIAPVYTQVNVVITDAVAQIQMVQLFVNPLDTTVQVKYVFPLPHQGAVHAMSFIVNDTLRHAVIMEREEAQAKYDSLTEAGAVASLLVQERPNIFEQSLSNLGAGDTAAVTISLSMPLQYADGTFELAFPTRVGDRCCTQGVDPIYGTLTGWNVPADLEGPRIQFNVALQSGFGISNISSPTHPIQTSPITDLLPLLKEREVINQESDLVQPNRYGVVLLQQSTYPNKDFVLRFQRTELNHGMTVSTWSNSDQPEKFFMLDLYPSELPEADSSRPPLDLMVLIDISGSQMGWPLEYEKDVAQKLIAQLNSGDRLCVMSFENYHKLAFADTLRIATSANIALAHKWIEGLQPLGGTELLTALQKLMTIPQTGGRHRVNVLLTDGFISNESAIFAYLNSLDPQPQMITFGAGSSLNRYFLDEAAAIGNGFSTVLVEGEDLEARTMEAWGKLSGPQISGLVLDFGTAQVSDLRKPVSQILYGGLPYRAYGRFSADAPFTITLSGILPSGSTVQYTKTVDPTQTNATSWVVPKLWARETIRLLELEEGTTSTRKDSIISVSLAHQVLSKYTAFLASDPSYVQIEEDYLVGYPGGSGVVGGVTPIESPVVDSRTTFQWTSVRQYWAADALRLEWPSTMGIERIYLYDSRGRLLAQWNYDVDTQGQWSIDGLAQGAMHERLILVAITRNGKFSTVVKRVP